MDCCGGMDEHDETCTEVKVNDGIDAGTVAAAKRLESENYSAGFVTDIEQEHLPPGLSEDWRKHIQSQHIIPPPVALEADTQAWLARACAPM